MLPRSHGLEPWVRTIEKRKESVEVQWRVDKRLLILLVCRAVVSASRWIRTTVRATVFFAVDLRTEEIVCASFGLALIRG